MTVEEANALKDSRACERCGCLGVEILINLNNHGAYLHCPHCGRDHVWADVQFLAQSKTKKREKAPETASETWERGGNHCWICGWDRVSLATLGRGINQHHTGRYAWTQHDSSLIPVCTGCHSFINLAQRVIDWAAKLIGLPKPTEEVRDDAA